MLIWRVAWHQGFGGTRTGETSDLPGFIKQLGHVDWVQVTGAYETEEPCAGT